MYIEPCFGEHTESIPIENSPMLFIDVLDRNLVVVKTNTACVRIYFQLERKNNQWGFIPDKCSSIVESTSVLIVYTEEEQEEIRSSLLPVILNWLSNPENEHYFHEAQLYEFELQLREAEEELEKAQQRLSQVEGQCEKAEERTLRADWKNRIKEIKKEINNENKLCN